MNLYEINELYRECFDLALDETGEISDDSLFKFLDEIKEAQETKIENIGLYYKNLLAESEAIKAEKNILAERERVAKNKAERLKYYLQSLINEGQKFKTARIVISWRKSSTVIIRTDPENLPDEFKKVTIDANKTAIKKHIQDGGSVDGASIKENKNIQIK